MNNEEPKKQDTPGVTAGRPATVHEVHDYFVSKRHLATMEKPLGGLWPIWGSDWRG